MARLKGLVYHLKMFDDGKSACGIEVSENLLTTYPNSVNCKRCLRHVRRMERFSKKLRLFGFSCRTFLCTLYSKVGLVCGSSMFFKLVHSFQKSDQRVDHLS